MSSSRRILLAGASGSIGVPLTAELERAGHEVIRLVRRQPAGTNEFRWDPYSGEIDERALKGLDAAINLSGAGIGDKRWTEDRKKVIYDSRIEPTRVLAQHLAELDEPPEVLLSQSATGIYGDRGDEILTEDSPLGPRDDFLSALTIDWEAAAAPAREAGILVVHPRTGLVLSRHTQLMQRLIPLYKAGLGGPLGDGRQWWSWITLKDVIAALGHLLESTAAGPVNLVAPGAVRQRDFSDALAKTVRRPAALTVPRFGLRLLLGSDKAESLGFSSARVAPQGLEELGFSFNHPELVDALGDIVR